MEFFPPIAIKHNVSNQIASFALRYIHNEPTGANIIIDVEDLLTLNFFLTFKDGRYRTDPNPVQCTGSGVLGVGKYSFDGTTYYNAFEGGLDQTYDCEVGIEGHNMSIAFKDRLGNRVGGFRGKSSDFPVGGKFDADGGTCNWKRVKDSASFKKTAVESSFKTQKYGQSSESRATVIVKVEDALDFQLMLKGLDLWTSANFVTTTGTGFVKSGTYEFDGSTRYNTLRELRQTSACRVLVTGNIVNVSFQDGIGKPVGEFEGTISDLPLVSSYNGSCQMFPLEY